ncbi:hypothetical protein K469DRAFT_721218 [Zopfia rhizophila CBS 207.26]|uniref:Heterokaryon incompatibility domain-containing protein n=1 Tax=Zopfia rhizophila CBS 207.26 TaxID=1314779 RepID=A0A6A6EF61_9PEZI|nr:hypothetical protein K469DRAFT_721218 [Zopfia rhizophila CBS 207.26]
MPLVATLAYLGDHSASDARDRVYSLLGLVTERDRRLVGNPDYTQSVEHIYARLVQSFWNEYHSLDIICFTHLFNRYAGNLDQSGDREAVPSWAPDWRANVQPSPVPLMASQSANRHIGNFRPMNSKKYKAMYNASGYASTPRARVRFHENLGEMWCDGVVLDYIDGLGGLDECATRCRSTACANSGHSMIQTTQTEKTFKENGKMFLKLLSAIARSLDLNREDKFLSYVAPNAYTSDFLVLCYACLNSDRDIDPLFETWWEQNKSLLLGGWTLEAIVKTVVNTQDQRLFAALPPPTFRGNPSQQFAGSDNTEETDCLIERFYDTVQKRSRRLMLTNNVYIGMAPCRARQGDVVAILFGCSIPLVLRRVGVREAFQVVGEAYVDGFMNGEVRRLLHRGERDIKKFRLV